MSDPNEMKEGGFLAVGVVEKPHGIKGKVRVKYYGDTPENLLALKDIRLGSNPDDLTHYQVQHIQPSRGLFILALEGFTYEKAQASVGLSVWVHRDQLPPLGEWEYYWEDLIGLRVLTENGDEIGIVCGVIPAGSNDVLVCKLDDRETLIPFLEDIVLDVDLEAGLILVQAVEGLMPD